MSHSGSLGPTVLTDGRVALPLRHTESSRSSPRCRRTWTMYKVQESKDKPDDHTTRRQWQHRRARTFPCCCAAFTLHRPFACSHCFEACSVHHARCTCDSATGRRTGASVRRRGRVATSRRDVAICCCVRHVHGVTAATRHHALGGARHTISRPRCTCLWPVDVRLGMLLEACEHGTALPATRFAFGMSRHVWWRA